MPIRPNVSVVRRRPGRPHAAAGARIAARAALYAHDEIAAFVASALQSYLLIDGLKVLVLGLTSAVAIPPGSLHPALLKLLRSFHRAVDVAM